MIRIYGSSYLKVMNLGFNKGIDSGLVCNNLTHTIHKSAYGLGALGPTIQKLDPSPLTRIDQVGKITGIIETKKGFFEIVLLDVDCLSRSGIDLDAIIGGNNYSRKSETNGTLVNINRTRQKKVIAALRQYGLEGIDFLDFKESEKAAFELQRFLLLDAGVSYFIAKKANRFISRYITCHLTFDSNRLSEQSVTGGVLLGRAKRPETKLPSWQEEY